MLIITNCELKFRTVHDIYKSDHCETDDELELIDKNLKNVIEKMKLASTKITYIEYILSRTENKLNEYGYGPYSGCRSNKCFEHQYYEINFQKVNFSIRKLNWEKQLLENMRSRFENYYSDLLFNYLV